MKNLVYVRLYVFVCFFPPIPSMRMTTNLCQTMHYNKGLVEDKLINVDYLHIKGSSLS